MATEDLIGRAILKCNDYERNLYDILVIIGVTKCMAGDELVLQASSGYKENVPFTLIKKGEFGAEDGDTRYELFTKETVRKLEKRWDSL